MAWWPNTSGSPSHVWSLGLWARGIGEAVAMKDKIGKCGRNINDIKESIEEDDNQGSFLSG